MLFPFKPAIARALGRLRKGELFGQKFEFGEDLGKLQSSADAVAMEEALPLEEGRVARADQEEKFDTTIKSILRQERAPRKSR